MSVPRSDVLGQIGSAPGRNVVEQSDGKVVGAFAKYRANPIQESEETKLVRFLANGAGLDTTFGADGVATVPKLSQISVDGNSRVLGGGGARLMRFTLAGGVDTSFGSSGVAGIASQMIAAPVFQKDGRIVVVTSNGLNRLWR